MIHISKIYRILISVLLAFLGFSCVNGRSNGCEYCSPSATYKAKGIVVSETDDSPIEGIRTELIVDLTPDYAFELDTTYTNSEGFFSLEGEEFPYQILYVKLTDVDGEENGSYAGKIIEADYTEITLTGGSGHWYEGIAEIDLGTIKMKPKESEEDKEPENPE
jgi:putative lipoprotein (rSAM/lipoprotein system)